MNDLNVIDGFMETFVRYIDSGFGLLQGDVAYLTTILIGIDITLAGLAWASDPNGSFMPRFAKKVLYVGFFAFILNNFQTLADIIFRSFAGLGLHASNNTLTSADLFRPGRIAGIGFEAAWPLLDQAAKMVGFTNFFDNIVTVIVLLLVWFIVIFAFFIQAVQLLIAIIEFKLTALAGFVLVPFALWNKSAFLAERVLGNVISSGIKVMVLAVIIGIGAGYFADFTNALNGQEPNLSQAMSLMLAAVALFGLSIFGPSIASGLVSGAPQLGAGAAIGTVGGLAAAGAVAGGSAIGAARLIGQGGVSAVKAGASLASGTSTAYQLGRAASGEAGFAGMRAGIGGVASAGAGIVRRSAAGAFTSTREGMIDAVHTGRQRAWAATGGTPPSASISPSGPSAADSGPTWAKNFKAQQNSRYHRHATAQAIKDGDKGGGAANPDLSEEK